MYMNVEMKRNYLMNFRLYERIRDRIRTDGEKGIFNLDLFL
jgi:hypothetical protein